MGKVISFVNQKGGVSKTTSSTNMAYILANFYNKKVLFIDFDGQCNATDTLGLLEEINKNINENEQPVLLDDLECSIADIMNSIILEDRIPDKKFIYKIKNMDLIPGSNELSMLENNLVNVEFQREMILKRFIDTLKNKYDYIIIDSLPKLGLQMINLLFASDEIIIPTHCAKKAINGFTELLKTINKVKRNGNEKLKVAGILITMANENTSAFTYLKEEIERNYSEFYIFKAVIPYVKKFEEGDLFGKLWVEYLPTNKASKRYFDFVEEFLENEKEK